MPFSNYIIAETGSITRCFYKYFMDTLPRKPPNAPYVNKSYLCYPYKIYVPYGPKSLTHITLFLTRLSCIFSTHTLLQHRSDPPAPHFVLPRATSIRNSRAMRSVAHVRTLVKYKNRDKQPLMKINFQRVCLSLFFYFTHCLRSVYTPFPK